MREHELAHALQQGFKTSKEKYPDKKPMIYYTLPVEPQTFAPRVTISCTQDGYLLDISTQPKMSNVQLPFTINQNGIWTNRFSCSLNTTGSTLYRVDYMPFPKMNGLRMVQIHQYASNHHVRSWHPNANNNGQFDQLFEEFAQYGLHRLVSHTDTLLTYTTGIVHRDGMQVEPLTGEFAQHNLLLPLQTQ